MAREHKVSESNSILVQTREYTGALRRLAQKSTTIEKARPPAWEPPNYSWSWSSGVFTLRWSASGTPAPGLQRRLQRPIRQNSKGNKSSEYLIYLRVLRPATKLICMYQMERGGCIVECKKEMPG